MKLRDNKEDNFTATMQDKDVDNEGQRDVVNHKISLFVLWYILSTVLRYCLACKGFISSNKSIAVKSFFLLNSYHT